MPYRFLEEIAIADVAFAASGKSREELFIAAADALMNVMVADLASIRAVEKVEISLENEALDMLLFNFLGELIFYKDARLLLLRVTSVRFSRIDALYVLNADAYGELLDPARHPLIVDVKAVTLHRFKVEKVEKGWQAEVVLDI